MQLEILRLLIENRNKKLDEEYKRVPHYNYLQEVYKDINNSNKFLIAYLIIYGNKSKEEASEIVHALNLNSYKPTDAELARVIDILMYLKAHNVLDSAKTYLLERNPFKIIKAWKKIDSVDGAQNLIMELKDLSIKFKIDLEVLIKLLNSDIETFLDIASIALDIKEKNCDFSVAVAKRMTYRLIGARNENSSVFSRKIKPYRIGLTEAKDKVKKYIEKLDTDEKSYYKSTKLEKYHNEAALELLEKEIKKKEITNVRALIKKIQDPKIKEIILLIVYKHNLSYMNELKEEYDKLLSNSTTRYISLLNEYGITIDENNLGSINHNSIDDLNIILSILKNIALPDYLYLNVLNITNLETSKEIKELTIKGYITGNVVLNNIDIFNKNNNLLNILKTNIQLFNNYQINPTIFSDIEEILFINSSLLDKNLKILENYNLIKSLKNSNNYNFLLNIDLAKLIDKYLELGYESLLEQDLDILNYQDTRRVEILNNMGIILEKDEFIDMFEYNKFFIPDEMLNGYINDEIKVEGNFNITLEELLEYRKTTRTIEINGILISINKVINALNNKKNMKEAIFTNMNIDIDTYKEIEAELKGKEYIK